VEAPEVDGQGPDRAIEAQLGRYAPLVNPAHAQTYIQYPPCRERVVELASPARRLIHVAQTASRKIQTLASSATWSAIASDDVNPGDSIPNRLTSPSTPWSRGPCIRKSCVATAGGTIFGRMPE